ncbi:MAG: BC85_0335 family putative methyltransferase [Metamycoplasmataceae bacterium]
MSNDQIRQILIISVIIISTIGLILGAFFFTKAFLLRKKIKDEQKILLEKEINSLEHEKVLSREDLFEVDFELKKIFSESKNSDETIEFCINTIIKNNYQNIFFINDNNPYEILSLMKKTGKTFFYEDQQKNIDLIENYCKENNIENLFLNEKSFDGFFDAILVLNSFDYLNDYLNNKNKIKEKGMFIITNINKNKKQKKELFNYLSKAKAKFDLLNWDNGFFLIVNQ